MKKLILALALLLTTSPAFSAGSSTGVFPMQVTIPSATMVNFVISEIEGTTFTSHTGNFLNWDAAGAGMKYLGGPGIWAGSRYFAIDFSPSDGLNPAPGNYGTISFSYGSQIVPSGQSIDEGLNKRATIAASKVVGATGSQTETPVIGARAMGVGAIPSLSDSDVAGGFLRVYVGLSTGELNANGVPLAANSKPFTNGDKGGVYTGTLTITATLL